MIWTTLISVEELANHIDRCLVVDCRHDLFEPDAGRQAYQQAHLPGAFFLHQDHDLAGTTGPQTGRHPLPDAARLRDALAALGLGPDTQLVAYDSAGGSTAARLWWLARWLGHTAVAVLDGGLPAWQAGGYPLESDSPRARSPQHLPERGSRAGFVELETLLENLHSRRFTVVDARSVERFAGIAEPIDPVAGHIPGALNHPLQRNLRPDGRFLPTELLGQAYLTLLAGRHPETIVHSCGSGVSACLNLLAMEHAGLPGSRLYPGSWSQWCSDPGRPVARELQSRQD